MTKEQAQQLKKGDKIRYDDGNSPSFIDIYTGELDGVCIELENYNNMAVIEGCTKLTKTIRDVEIGEELEHYHGRKITIIDVGKYGIIDKFNYYRTFERMELDGWKIKEEEEMEECKNCLYKSEYLLNKIN